LALVIQGLFAYLVEYFAANYALSDKLTGTAADGTAVTGMDAAAASGAPIGDMIVQIGNSMLGGAGFGIMIIVAITVALAMLLTILGVGFIGGGDAQTESIIALVIAGLWLAASLVYVVIDNQRSGKGFWHLPEHPQGPVAESGS